MLKSGGLSSTPTSQAASTYSTLKSCDAEGSLLGRRPTLPQPSIMGERSLKRGVFGQGTCLDTATILKIKNKVNCFDGIVDQAWKKVAWVKAYNGWEHRAGTEGILLIKKEGHWHNYRVVFNWVLQCFDRAG